MDRTVLTQRDLFQSSDTGPTPRIEDVRQGLLGNCWFASSLAAMAQQQPERIVDAIGYDRQTETFSVRLYAQDEQGQTQAVVIPVSQFELTDHLATLSAGLKNPDGSQRPIWQSVMEVGMAKYFDEDHTNGIEEGYKKLDSAGYSADAFAVLTGEVHTVLGDIDVREMGTEKLHQRLQAAMESGQPITIGTKPEVGETQDGLSDRHSYAVVGVGRDARGEPVLDLRNPYGYNGGGEGRDSDQAVVRVRLADLVKAESISEVAIGPQAVRVQQREASGDPTSLEPAERAGADIPRQGATVAGEQGRGSDPHGIDLLPGPSQEIHRQAVTQARRLGLEEEDTQNLAMAMTRRAKDNPLIRSIDDIVAVRGGAEDGGLRVHFVHKMFGDKPPFFNDYVDANQATKTPALENAQEIARNHDRELATTRGMQVEESMPRRTSSAIT
jgi:hypothetical protein